VGKQMSDSLLALLQSETGPSRELDAEIALANGWTRKEYEGKPCWRAPGHIVWNEQPPRYTESIDAALTLVPIIDGPRRGLWTRLHESGGAHGTNGCKWMAELWGLKGDETFSFIGYHATAALALLIAIERAKEDTKP
jgi:hypothetical protein